MANYRRKIAGQNWKCVVKTPVIDVEDGEFLSGQAILSERTIEIDSMLKPDHMDHVKVHEEWHAWCEESCFDVEAVNRSKLDEAVADAVAKFVLSSLSDWRKLKLGEKGQRAKHPQKKNRPGPPSKRVRADRKGR